MGFVLITFIQPMLAPSCKMTLLLRCMLLADMARLDLNLTIKRPTTLTRGIETIPISGGVTHSSNRNHNTAPNFSPPQPHSLMPLHQLKHCYNPWLSTLPLMFKPLSQALKIWRSRLVSWLKQLLTLPSRIPSLCHPKQW